MAIGYSQIQPSPALATFIECYWILDGILSADEQQPERVLPDGCMELIFHRGEPFRRDETRQPHAFVVGQMLEPIVLIPSRKVNVLGVRFQPGGAYPFFDFPLHQMRSRFETIDIALGSSGRELEDQVLNAHSTIEAIGCIERMLLSCLRSARLSYGRAHALARTLLDSHGKISVRSLADRAGISTRQLEREFNSTVGLSPKALAQVFRFQKVFQAMEDNNKWVDVAFECGYYDQAHLIADFRRFAGTSPTAFRLDEFELGRHFLRATRSQNGK